MRREFFNCAEEQRRATPERPHLPLNSDPRLSGARAVGARAAAGEPRSVEDEAALAARLCQRAQDPQQRSTDLEHAIPQWLALPGQFHDLAGVGMIPR